MYNEPGVEKRCMAITLRDTYTSSTAKLKRPVETSLDRSEDSSDSPCRRWAMAQGTTVKSRSFSNVC